MFSQVHHAIERAEGGLGMSAEALVAALERVSTQRAPEDTATSAELSAESAADASAMSAPTSH